MSLLSGWQLSKKLKYPLAHKNILNNKSLNSTSSFKKKKLKNDLKCEIGNKLPLI